MKKLGLICLTLVLALGFLGVGYSMWTDTLTVTGAVQTGSLCMEFWTPITIEDPYPPPPYVPPWPIPSIDMSDWNVTPGFVSQPYRVDKNVGWATANMVGTPPYKEIEVTIHNTYPCYYNHISFWVHNCGSIPWIIQEVKFIVGTTVVATITESGVVQMDLSGNGVNDFEVDYGNNFGEQRDPCQKLNISFGTHMLQDEHAMGKNLTFKIQIIGVQWNDYKPSP